MELHEEKEKNPDKALLIQDEEEEGLKPGTIQKEQWLIPCYTANYLVTIN